MFRIAFNGWANKNSINLDEDEKFDFKRMWKRLKILIGPASGPKFKTLY